MTTFEPPTHAKHHVRDARSSDATTLMRIYNREVLETTATLDAEPRTLEEQTMWLAERSGGHVVIVVELDGIVAGFASLSPFKTRAAYRPTVENSVYVDPDFQRQGLGRILMSELVERARLFGYHSVIARIAEGNPGSVALHEAFGYRVVGVEREVGRKFGRWLDVTEMQLML
ncbi:GNAT family N-acetyltransferase [Acidimicrobiales bacterium]|nr:GNAT family N-acetyltransferase [Acidimicrobiales bacterium]